MLFAEEVVDGLDRVEGGHGNLDKEGDPVGHGAVPEAGEFLRLDCEGAFGLLADEAGLRVDILTEVEIAAAVVLGAADEVDGVEMGRGLENIFLLRIVVVDLGGFDHLKASTSLGINSVEGATSRFSEVFHHATDAHGAVEKVVQGLGIATFWYHDVKLLFCEADELVEGALVGLAVEGAESVEGLLSQFKEHSGEYLFVNHGGVLHPVGHHVVDVLDKDEVGALLVEVFYQGTVATGTEHQASVVVAHRVVLFVDGYGVGVMFLFREGYLQFDAEGAFVVLLHFGNLAPEGGAMFGRDGKVQVDSAVGVACIERSFNDVFLEGGALHLAVAVEFQQGLGQVAVAEVLLFEEEVDDGAVVAATHVFVDVEVGALHARLQVVIEGEGAKVLEEFFYFGKLFFEICGHAKIGGGEAVKVFEHARCSSGGGDELEDFLPACECTILFFVAGDFFLVQAQDAAIGRCGGIVEVAFGEAGLEVVYLLLHGLDGETHLGELFEVLLGGFKYHVL